MGEKLSPARKKVLLRLSTEPDAKKGRTPCGARPKFREETPEGSRLRRPGDGRWLARKCDHDGAVFRCRDARGGRSS